MNAKLQHVNLRQRVNYARRVYRASHDLALPMICRRRVSYALRKNLRLYADGSATVYIPSRGNMANVYTVEA